MQLIDSHCHLDFAVFDPQREALLQQWRRLGVCHMVVPAIGEVNWAKVMALAEVHQGISYSLGVHPWYVGDQSSNAMANLRQHLAARPAGLVAVGECGLDLRSHVPQAGQIEWFRGADRHGH